MLKLSVEKCAICLASLDTNYNWASLFTNKRNSVICGDCSSQLKEIPDDTCKICDRPLASLKPTYVKNNICYDCVRWEKSELWQNVLRRNYSLFLYNDFLKEVLAQFKYRGDYAVCCAFREAIIAKIATLTYDLIVPIPLSAERLYERGFNQASALLVEANLPFKNILARKHSEKQAKKSRQERLTKEQVFSLKDEGAAKNKQILLFDDIYTTGTTLRQAAKLLKEAGAKSITSITLARS